MKKFINSPQNLIEEMLEGFVAANSNKVRRLETERVLVRKDAPVQGKVGIVTGGGSGHKPAFIGYIGKGLVDAVAVGDIFAAPPVQRAYEAIKAANGGKGVLLCIGNYSGDIMNFGMAKELAEAEGIPVETVVVNDDVASSPKERMDNRRGVAGEVILWKIAGALAEEGADLQKLKEVGERAVFNTRSMGVAHTPCVLPTTGKPSFEIGEDEMEIGVGHHGEPGIQRTKMMSADEVSELLTLKVIEDLPFKSGDEVVVLINGLGSTSLLEMYICFRKVNQILADHNIKVHRTYVGEFFTSLEMGGFSVTLTKLDDELKRLIDAPCDGVHFIQH
ncbi:MAG: phosphoenolpyruvate---glycerone phosphotransferase subunit DhaK [Candidatus Atribacteria bacterium]|jgi:dihydroxyacetone kinase-like protein|uniref:Dihydroxyacetone kinase subunit DhaK n=1 Tax=Thermatribacter velox TaxID=3039681 RepID=A0ABZ2Y9U0_9BACT|nr:phosphoenolpyruvate---glycerone phosphotransferase subunit DhaK [Candidatus Atribacteria bacterium]MDI3530477.1 phosphoenolpyruvate---glycerone phosphotransferase subunit DhaK [Candidatus Atribacteria bacterium]